MRNTQERTVRSRNRRLMVEVLEDRRLLALFSGSFTGGDLFNDPTIQFPTRQPTTNGSSLAFGPGSIAFEKLLELPLVPPNQIPSNEPTTIAFDINMTRITSDFDLRLLVGDGNNLVGISAADNSNGLGESISFVDGGNVGSNEFVKILYSDFGMPGVGGAYTVHGEIELLGSSTDVLVAAGSKSGSDTLSRTLNPASGLSFVLVGNDSAEEYGINSLSITVDAGVPDLIATDLTIDNGNVNFSYEIAGGDVPVGSITSAGLYWSDNSTFEPADLNRQAYSRTIVGGQSSGAVGNYDDSVSLSALAGTPDKYLLLVVDPFDDLPDEPDSKQRPFDPLAPGLLSWADYSCAHLRSDLWEHLAAQAAYAVGVRYARR